MSVTYSGRITQLKIDGRFTKILDQALKTLVRKAARAWLAEVFIRVPVWSGESRGSLKFATGPNGNLARAVNLAIPINAPHPRPDKNEITGGRQGRYNFTSQNHFYTFSWRSNVIQFEINNFYKDVSPTSPWQAELYGAIAFHAVIVAGMPKLPKIKKYIIKESIEL